MEITITQHIEEEIKYFIGEVNINVVNPVKHILFSLHTKPQPPVKTFGELSLDNSEVILYHEEIETRTRGSSILLMYKGTRTNVRGLGQTERSIMIIRGYNINI